MSSNLKIFPHVAYFMAYDVFYYTLENTRYIVLLYLLHVTISLPSYCFPSSHGKYLLTKHKADF